jgi:hypothetical protein
MATPYSTITDRFSNKITDPDLSLLIEAEFNEVLYNLMFSSCSKFTTSLIDLSDRNETTKTFNQDLTDDIIDIISEGMIVEWLKPKVYHSDNLSNFLNNKDLSLAASPANILKEMKETLKESRSEFDSLVIAYSYNNSDASSMI